MSTTTNFINDFVNRQQQQETVRLIKSLQQQIDALQQAANVLPSFSLSSLHAAVQDAAGSLFATTHYSQAILSACNALDKAVQIKSQRTDLSGATLMTTAFSQKSPLVQLSPDQSEQLGFMTLYQGAIQALRNHHAHNLTQISSERAFEWLGFISALFYKLEEGVVMVAKSSSSAL